MFRYYTQILIVLQIQPHVPNITRKNILVSFLRVRVYVYVEDHLELFLFIVALLLLLVVVIVVVVFVFGLRTEGNKIKFYFPSTFNKTLPFYTRTRALQFHLLRDIQYLFNSYLK